MELRRAVTVFIPLSLVSIILSSCANSNSTNDIPPSQAQASPTPSVSIAAPADNPQVLPSPSVSVTTPADNPPTRTRDPSTYNVLNAENAKEHLTLERSGNQAYLSIYSWRIESFDFLDEFEGITSLLISWCYIPPGITIPSTDALNSIVNIDFCEIYGSGAADVLSDCLPLPYLDALSLDGEVQNETALPTIPSLTDLYVSVPDALSVIANNAHITGSLRFGETYCDGIESIQGVERFSSIQHLELPRSVRDLTPVAGCAALKILNLLHNMDIDSLRPLYGLEHLQEIQISRNTYNELPEDEREHFSPHNNGDAYAVHVYIDPPRSSADGQHCQLSGQIIDSFDFLLGYSNLKSLYIYDCDIADGLVLPEIGTLTRLYVVDPNVLDIIKNNTRLTEWLYISTGEYDYLGKYYDSPELTGLDGLEEFTSLESLTVGFPVYDLSALSGCANLRSVSLMHTASIETLGSLCELPRLRWLHINEVAFLALPAEDQEYFNSRKWYITQIVWRD